MSKSYPNVNLFRDWSDKATKEFLANPELVGLLLPERLEQIQDGLVSVVEIADEIWALACTKDGLEY
jgi:hypothetical protein